MEQSEGIEKDIGAVLIAWSRNESETYEQLYLDL